MKHLENIIEGILFVSGEPVSYADILAKLDITKKELETAISHLKEKYSGDSGISLLNFNSKIQLSSSPSYAEEISAVLNPIRQRNLTKATLETASIIAYKQPITRLEIEEIRGVSCDYAINILLEHKLIEIVGHKETVGKPALFGTTDEFLKRFDISSIDELPNYEDMLKNIEKINAKAQDDSLFNFQQPATPDLDQKLTDLNKEQNLDDAEIIGTDKE